jgi:hypothetical protein
LKPIVSWSLQAIGRLSPRIAWWLFPLLIFLHNPRRLIRPEMWGEDGPVWYADAYALGLGSLLLPAGGYLNSIQRLVAIAVQSLPLAWTPFLFQLAAVMIQAAPAIFLVSSRMDAVWPDRASRCLFALLYLLMPNAPETAAGLTNSQWYLAILAFLLIVSTPPSGFLGRLVETVVLLVAGFSGPFCILLMPAAVWEAFVAGRSGRADSLRRLITLAAAGLVQATLILLVAGGGRGSAPLGATPDLLIRIVGMISLGAEFGYRSMVDLSRTGLISVSPILYVAAFGSAMLMTIAVAKGPRILAQFTIFAAGVFALALARPLISLTAPQWPPMLIPPSGNRYFLFPMIAWWGALFVLAGLPNRSLRMTARTLLAVTIFFAIPRDWGDLLAYPPTDFIARARAFDLAPPGTKMGFHIHPPPWKFSLTK